MEGKIEVQGLLINIEKAHESDYIAITDIAKRSERRPGEVIRDWLRNTDTMLFLEAWEKLHNPNFNGAQMLTFRLEAQKNRNSISPQNYIERTNAIGLLSKSGRYGGGTYAHRDIALQFCSWFEPVFYVYMIKAFQQMIEEKYQAKSLEWHVKKITDNVDEIRNLLDTIPGQVAENRRIGGDF